MEKVGKVNIYFSNYRYLFDEYIDNSDKILQDLSKSTIYNDVIFPCDVIDLRKILEDKKICCLNNIALFSPQFANKYLKKFPIFLTLNNNLILEEEECIKNIKGAKFLLTNILDISSNIKNICINFPIENITKYKIINIIKEISPEINYFISNSVPGISGYNEKLSKKVNIKTKYAKELKKYKRYKNGKNV